MNYHLYPDFILGIHIEVRVQIVACAYGHAAGVLPGLRGVAVARPAASALPERYARGLDALRAPEQHRGQGLPGQ